MRGQTQKRYGENEKALEPESIRDVKAMLDPSFPGTRITNHKILSGIMFFEVVMKKPRLLRSGRLSYVRNFLVAGEDLHKAGCIAAMYLSDGTHAHERDPYLETVHGTSVDDTRGGFSQVAFCSALQLRGLTEEGKPSTSYTAYQRSRKSYYTKLLSELDDSIPFRNQNWQAVQNVIDGHRYLLPGNNTPHRPEMIGDEFDYGDDQDHDPGPHPARYDGEDENNNDYWINELGLLQKSADALGNDDEDFENHERMVFSVNEDMDEDLDMEDGTTTARKTRHHYNKDRPSRSVSIPRSRHTSAETAPNISTQSGTDDDDLDLVMYTADNAPDLDINRVSTSQSPRQPKPEPKIEPSPEVTITNEDTLFRSMNNFIDLTRPEVIDLTQVKDLVVKKHSSGIDLIELED